MSHNTAVLLVDPLNDFLHPEGKSFSMLKESLDASDTVKNMIKVVETARKAGIPIYYGLHQPTGNGAYNGWNHMRTNHHRIRDNKIFEHGSFGAEIHEDLKPNIDGGDVVASRHWNSRQVVEYPGGYIGELVLLTLPSSFANTDLDYLLRQHNITHLVCAGMVANTCLETTARYGIEL